MPVFEVTAQGGILVGLLAVALILTLWFAFRRLKDSNITRQLGVVLFNLVAFMSLAMWILQPTWQQQKIVSAVLFTQGSEDMTLPAGQHEALYAMDSAHVGKDIEQLAGIEEIFTHEPGLQSLHVIGDGLTSWQWQRLYQARSRDDEIRVYFTPSDIITGLIDVNWSARLGRGQRQVVTGRLQTPYNQMLYTVSLEDPVGDVLDSVNLRGGQAFQFSFVPNATGQWRYSLTLQETGTKAILVQEPLAFAVSAAQQPRILVHQSAPNFETRHMKNWATEFGVSMTVVTQISQQRWISQHVNSPGEQVSQGSSPIAERKLDNYDLLILDGRSWQALLASDKSYIDEQIEQGLGVVLQADSTLVESVKGGQQQFGGIDFSVADEPKALREALPNMPGLPISLPVKVLNLNMSGDSTDVLIADTTGSALLIAQRSGLGRRAVSLLTKTYAWKTAGELAVYGRYWQTLLSQVSRNNADSRWQQHESKPTPFSQHQACLTSTDDVSQMGYDSLVGETKPVLFHTDGLTNNQYCTFLWAEQSGWHRIAGAESAQTHWYYVFPASAWQASAQYQKHQASLANRRDPVIQPSAVNEPLSRIWYWLLLVVSLTVLWLERRFF